jgi:hypothetical protein
MSWSDDPTAPAGGQDQQWRQLAELDLALRLSRQAGHDPQGLPDQVPSGQPGYAYPNRVAGQVPPGYPGPPAPQPVSYHYPQSAPPETGYPRTGNPSGNQAPAFVARSASQGHGHSPHAPQFDPYAPGQSQSFNAHAGHQAARSSESSPFPSRGAHLHDTRFTPVQTGSTAPNHRQPLPGTLHDPHPELRGASYDQWPAAHPPGGYDLGSYMPSGAASHRTYDAQQQSGGRLPHVDPQWPGGDGLPDPAADQAYYQHSYSDNESLLMPGQPQDHEDTDYEVEEPRRGYRGAAIVVALVAAIVSGGGLAYAYKTLVGPAANAIPPVVRADNRPAKTHPADPGGKQFSHQDSKLMGRLGEESASTTSSQPPELASLEAEGSGVRKVSTVVVGRDGSIGLPAVESAPRLPPPVVTVPGMMIVDGFAGRGSVALATPRRPIELVPQSAEPAQTVPATPAPAAVRSQPIAKVTPAFTPAGLGSVAPPSPPPLAKKIQRATPVAAVLQPPSPATTVTAPVVKTGTAGYVVVLSSQKSRIDALMAFADLQQKYGSVLENKVPDVREADLSARGLGTVYRVVVGPPGSREAANGICDQLKSAGFTGCWITTY